MTPDSSPSERVCPHCNGSGRGPQNGAWGELLTQAGVIPAECQNCGGRGSITVKTCRHCEGEFVPVSAGQALCTGCTYLQDVGGTLA